MSTEVFVLWKYTASEFNDLWIEYFYVYNLTGQ